MTKDKFNIIKRLKAENCTVEQLEQKIIAECPKTIIGEMSENLKALFYVRKQQLNNTFEWTPEDVERLLVLDKKLIKCCEKMYNEAKPLQTAFKQRIENKDSFLHDFEIHAKLTPFILLPNENGVMEEPWDGIERILNESLSEFDLCFSVSALEDILNTYRKKEFNWSHDNVFKGNLNGQYVSFLVHELYNTNKVWSIPDILKINELWAELYVRHQHFIDLMDEKTIV